ncbi:MAG: hypothetical protein NC433_17685 [Clostridiales bacterium]|nr:hypothetical protein [Clostridiales bacterium]
MKKKLLSLFLTSLCVVSMLTGCGGKKENADASPSDMTPVTLNEVAHSMKYPNKSNTTKRR